MKKIASFMLSAILLLSLTVVAGAAPAEEATPGEWDRIAAHYLEKYGTLTDEQEQMLEDLRPYAAIFDEIHAADDMANVRLAEFFSLDVLWEIVTAFSVESYYETQTEWARHAFVVLQANTAAASVAVAEDVMVGETITIEHSQEELDTIGKGLASGNNAARHTTSPARAERSGYRINIYAFLGGVAWVDFETELRGGTWYFNKATGSGYKADNVPVFMLTSYTPEYASSNKQARVLYSGNVLHSNGSVLPESGRTEYHTANG